ncbi:penicillin-binding transpeptidase domain-containing protein [Aquibacillus halophilus]|uniref:serine-type D-Ala-D-Ala carboxypeptidase n=1 Tax=Aquibacillus halophilus TaxID=930132 RepID=A0A6A8D871_9BACI|nr:penicillin-binding transpeptidase domain-containing protein [Aquibacillus halophilus]MRH41955.1 penicillin-binding transpeptidase domain-containing protein [Aquibacillus halophilus]
MRKISLMIFILLLVILSACSEEEVKPEDRLTEYIQQWNELNYSSMYEMIFSSSKEEYSTEQFVDRYQKIYNDLNVTNLNVTFDIPAEDEEEEKSSEEDLTKTFPIHVEMDTLAGPITFDYQATMVQQELSEDEITWFVEWDPGFIFPELKAGGDIEIINESPIRGQIFDRFHNGLAVNESVFNLGVVPERFADNPDQEKQAIADALDIDVETIDSAIGASWVEPQHFVPLKMMPTITEEQADQLHAKIEPLTYQATTGRIYPYGKATAHLTGYIGKITAEELEELDPTIYSANDVIGKSGLESIFEERLKGEKGIKIVVKQEGEEDHVIAEKPVKNGETINLTIDAELQTEIYTSYQDNAGTAAAIHPKTGETLALVSSPSYDPNEFAYGISSANWEAIQNDPQLPLLNRFSSTFSPGSTIKPVTGAIGLQSGTIVPGEGIEINGLTWSNGDSWGNNQVRRVSESTGPVDLTDALVRSDNIFFARKAIEMGNETFVSGLNHFGFGEDIQFPYPIQQSKVSSSGEIDREILLADTSYGQGEMQISALHLALTYTPFLNNGTMLNPVLEMDQPTGEAWKTDLVSGEHALLIQEALRMVVTSSKGTAQGANIANAKLSGKTGTAELKTSLDDDNGKENGWFVAYPEEHDLLIAMMVEEQNSGYVVNTLADIFR